MPSGAGLPLPQGFSGRLLAGDEAALAEVASTGWVESVGVRTPGLGSVSAPVCTDEGIIPSVCLAMPLARVSKSPGHDFGQVVIQAAARIADAMDRKR
jgi:DNA-binding IclR family transcriptional regulator